VVALLLLLCIKRPLQPVVSASAFAATSQKMHTCAPPHHFSSLKFPELHGSSKLNNLQVLRSFGLSKRNFKVFAVAASSSSSMSEASNYIPAAPIFLPEGPWQQVSFARYFFY
jgi:hypothetical protein